MQGPDAAPEMMASVLGMNQPHTSAFTEAFDPAHRYPQPEACYQRDQLGADPNDIDGGAFRRVETTAFVPPAPLLDQTLAIIGRKRLPQKVEQFSPIA